MPRSPLERWRFALKPASWPKLLVPALLGHGLGVDVTGSIAWGALALGLVLTALDTVFVVCLNDWGDQKVDALKRRMFPESSPKTIPDGVLPASVLAFAGITAGIFALVLAALFGPLLGRPLLLPMMAGALGLFWLYSLPPIRLNYRGGGELLEAIGVGLALPLLSSYLQSGALAPPSVSMLLGWTLLALSSAVASGLSDERSDAAGGKRTFVTWLGNARSRTLIEVLALVGPLLWLGAAFFIESGPPKMLGILAALFAFDEWWTLKRRSHDAQTDAFASLQHYKAALHALIWRAGLVWALGFSVGPLLGW